MVNEIFDILIDQLNENTYGKRFAGNVIFRFYTNTNKFEIEEVDEDTLTIDTHEFVPVVEHVSEQIPYVDKNGRSDWLKSFLFAIRVDKDEKEFDVDNEFYKAMIETVEAMNGSTLTANSKRYAFKVNYPKQQGRFVHGDSWYVMFDMTINLASVEHGTFGNDFQIWIAEYDNPQDIYDDDFIIDFTQWDIKMGKATKSVHVLNTEDTKSSVVSRTTHIDCVLNYRGTDIEEVIREDIFGSIGNEMIYRIRVLEGDLDYHKPYILTGGGIELKNNALLKLTCRFEIASDLILPTNIADPTPPAPPEEGL